MGERLEVLKTYKIFIGGKFPRTESGRYYPLKVKDKTIANICLCSRKDFRNAVVAARGAQAVWAERAAFNRSQIIYRMAEILEGRKVQFVEELMIQGVTKVSAEKEVYASIDRLVYYAGWCDKYQQVFSSVNPVASAHFNFSAYEPQGVVSAVAPENSGLLGLVSLIAPIIAGGNTIVILASEKVPLCAVSLSEVINTSDVPGGVINILTGNESELISHMATHMDVNAVAYGSDNEESIKVLEENASLNMKRIAIYDDKKLKTEESPYMLLDFQEVKTTWHPVEQIGGASAKY